MEGFPKVEADSTLMNELPDAPLWLRLMPCAVVLVGIGSFLIAELAR